MAAKAVRKELTSKMSHAGSWRAACLMTIWIPEFHFGDSFGRTRRDIPALALAPCWALPWLEHRCGDLSDELAIVLKLLSHTDSPSAIE